MFLHLKRIWNVFPHVFLVAAFALMYVSYTEFPLSGHKTFSQVSKFFLVIKRRKDVEISVFSEEQLIRYSFEESCALFSMWLLDKYPGEKKPSLPWPLPLFRNMFTYCMWIFCFIELD